MSEQRSYNIGIWSLVSFMMHECRHVTRQMRLSCAVVTATNSLLGPEALRHNQTVAQSSALHSTGHSYVTAVYTTVAQTHFDEDNC